MQRSKPSLVDDYVGDSTTQYSGVYHNLRMVNPKNKTSGYIHKVMRLVPSFLCQVLQQQLLYSGRHRFCVDPPVDLWSSLGDENT